MAGRREGVRWLSSRNILDFIPKGKENAIKRTNLAPLVGVKDRDVRKEIQKARMYCPIINLQNGDGYFIPEREDIQELKQYIKQEESRLKSIGWSLRAARKTLKEYEAYHEQ